MPPPLHAAAELGIDFRPALDEDLPFLAAVYHSTRSEELAGTGWSEEQKRAFLDQQHQAQHSHYATVYPGAERLVIRRGGEDIGRLYLIEWDGDLRIIDISLLPRARGKGAGEAILRDIGSHAERSGRIVSIHVEKFNPARRLYERLGFEVAEEKGVYDLMRWTPRTA